MTQKVAVSIDVTLQWLILGGLGLTSFWEMLTLIRLGSLKLLHVITQNNLNTSTRVQCFCCWRPICFRRSASAVTWASAPGIKQLSALYVSNSHSTVCSTRTAVVPHLPVYVSQGRVILSNKMARTVAFFYTLFLHCLVFLVRGQESGAVSSLVHNLTCGLVSGVIQDCVEREHRQRLHRFLC